MTKMLAQAFDDVVHGRNKDFGALVNLCLNVIAELRKLVEMQFCCKRVKVGDGLLKRYRLQSAMEYLMTYGWAILVVARGVGRAWRRQLGVFSSTSLAPRAQPGSCRVFRPNGPGTTTFINLAGISTGQLPQFVGSFNPQSSYVAIPDSGSIHFGTGSFTIAVSLTHKQLSSYRYL